MVIMSTELEDAFAWVFGGIIMDDAHEEELKIASNIAREICGESIIDNDEWYYVTQEIQDALYCGCIIIVEE
jgi:hypothetical protein